ncbi:MAG: PAS domain-containing protein [Deltaproteobacteria bacterium]|nr:PAS domain-containing protein [Deltaproteobacteria bacterium]
MKHGIKFIWFAASSVVFTLVLILSFALLFWQQLLPDEQTFLLGIFKRNFGYIFIAALLLLSGLGFALVWVFRFHILPMDKLAEECTLINSVNPSHRIQPKGGRGIARLAKVINEWAEHFENSQNNIKKRIEQAKSESEEEKNILAAIMAELSEGVLICNREGQILLYNKRAKRFLISDEAAGGNESGRFIGLGRSVFSIIDKNLIVHAIDEIADKLKRKATNVFSYFVVADNQDRLLRVEAAPILDNHKEFKGYILTLHDITQQLESDSRIDSLLQSLRRGIRGSLASVRAAIEAIREFPDMDRFQLDIFTKIIHKESITISNIIEKVASNSTYRARTRWPLVQMKAKDMLDVIKRKTKERLDIKVNIEKCSEDIRIQVDSYSIVLATLFLFNKLKKETKAKEFDCAFEKKGQFINLDLLWHGSPIKIEILKKWDEQFISIKDESIPLTLKEVIKHHEGEIWSYAFKDPKKSYLRLLFPAIESSEPKPSANPTILPESRPEFYNFDLFNQPGQNTKLDNRPLDELSYTVFDTETTGLNPTQGDEIISIGALRLINGTLLYEENFDQLIDPNRSLPFESVQIHGIKPEMLRNQPKIDQVLPLFHKFSEDTILVAHNASFDMAMIEEKEEQTGVKFTNPVLDTLLLSSIVHPFQEDHNLEAIAARLGVRIVGRHTALGDAIAAGEIFLKLIPLLAKQGIYTLKEARLASRKSFYARQKF